MTVLTTRLRTLGFRLIHRIPWPVRRALAAFIEGSLINIVKWGSTWQRKRGRSQSAEDLAKRLAWYAWRRVESRDWNGARFFAKGAIAADPLDADGYRMLAYAYEGSGAANLAREVCERGLRAGPNNALLSEELGSIEARAQRFAAAEALWRQAMQHRPDEPRIVRRLVGLLEGQRRWSEALPLLLRLQDLEPSDNAFMVRLATAYVNTGSFEKAEEILSGVIATEPTSANAHYWLAISQAGMDRWDDSIQQAGIAVQLAPDDEHYRKIHDLFRETGGKGVVVRLDDRSAGEDNAASELRPPD